MGVDTYRLASMNYDWWHSRMENSGFPNISDPFAGVYINVGLRREKNSVFLKYHSNSYVFSFDCDNESTTLSQFNCDSDEKIDEDNKENFSSGLLKRILEEINGIPKNKKESFEKFFTLLPEIKIGQKKFLDESLDGVSVSLPFRRPTFQEKNFNLLMNIWKTHIFNPFNSFYTTFS